MSKSDKPTTTGLKIESKENVFVNCEVKGFDIGVDLTKSAKGNKFFNTSISSKLAKSWHEKPVGFIAITIFCGLVVGFLLHYFGWV